MLPSPLASSPRPRARDGVFETILALDGRLVELEPHLRRLEASVRELYGATTPADARARAEAAARELATGRVRITVTPGADGLTTDVRCVAVDRTAVLPGWNAAQTLAPYVSPWSAGRHKWADRGVLEQLEADAAPSLPLLVDAEGAVLEASRANVFVVGDGGLSTPPADDHILPGVTRALVLELAVDAGLEAGEALLSLEDLLAADEVFLTGAIGGIMPVRACGEARWRRGDVTARLAGALRRRWFGS